MQNFVDVDEMVPQKDQPEKIQRLLHNQAKF